MRLNIVALIVIAWSALTPAWADTEQDIQQWSLFFGNYNFNEKWAASFQIENRVGENITERQQTILKPGVYRRLTDTLQLGVGYKRILKSGEPLEQDAWEELFYRPGEWLSFSWTHQLRWEQRFVGGIDGTVNRVRYLLHGARPFASNPKWYFAAQNAFRINLASNDKGPVDGFEQNRLYFGFGKILESKPTWKIEFGYLWRYQRERIGDNRSDHAIRLQLLFDTWGRHPPHGGS